MEPSLRKVVEPLHGSEVLAESRLLEFGVGAAKIVAVECAGQSHSAGQKSAAKRAISECGDLVLAAIGQDLVFDPAFEQIVRGLQHVQRSKSAKLFHLLDRKVADAD